MVIQRRRHPWLINLSTQSYPDGLSVAYEPNALGQPTRAGVYATGVSYYPNGAIKQFTYGNGIVHTMGQNARQLPSASIDCTATGACATANKRLDLAYKYDANGSVTNIADGVNGRQTRGMVYEGLDRLTQVTSNMFGTASYSYDVMDNLTHVRLTGGQARDQYYCYDKAWRLANIKTSSCSGTTVVGLGYDVQGNLVNKNGQKYTFDYGNRLRYVTGKESYRYDGLGRRVLAWSSKLSNIVSVYTKDGQLWYQNDQRRRANLNHIYLGGSLVAIREMVGSAQTVKYQHTDALGTPIAVTGANKALVQTSEYEPYGQLLNRTLTDGPRFTGHVQDAATGLTYMQQRYYDPMGVFLSVDPVTAYEKPMTNFNRYAYAANNPYKFVDPDGRDIKCAGNACQLVPIGGNLPTVNFPRPEGFPASISPTDSTFHHVYRFNDSAGSGDAAYGQRVNQQLVNNPTPMENQPATLQGNKINVNANNAISKFTGQDNVMSYQVPLPNGGNAVLNVTTGDHAATWGIVLRATQSGSGGSQSIVTYGEGNSFLQRAFDPNNNQSRQVWLQSAEEITRKAEQP